VANLFLFIFLKGENFSRVLKIIIFSFSFSEKKSPSCEKSQKTTKKTVVARLLLSCGKEKNPPFMANERLRKLEEPC